MDDLLERLKQSGVHSIKSDDLIILEILEDERDAVVEIDVLINELLNRVNTSRFEKVLLECPIKLLEGLNHTKFKMELSGERIIYTRSFAKPIKCLAPNYELWSIAESKSVSFLSEVMGRSLDDTEKFLTRMKVELPSQAHKMYTVFIVDHEPAGVVFPHIEPDTNKEGRIFWIGMHPKFRGKGFGKHLHVIGLYRLQKEFKAKSYLGATQVHNQPMRRIMVSNGCVQNPNSVISLEYKLT